MNDSKYLKKEAFRDVLLRLKDLSELTGVHKSTLNDWIFMYGAFIPIIRQGAVKYYRREAVDVIQRIQYYRSLDKDKVTIIGLLQDDGFPTNDGWDNETELEKAVKKNDRDAVIVLANQMMQFNEEYENTKDTVDKTKSKVYEMDETLQKMQQDASTNSETLSKALKIIEELQTEVKELKSPWYKKIFK